MARRGKRSICGPQAAMECWGCYCVARTDSFFLKWGYLQTSARSPNKKCGEDLAVLRCGFAEWQRLTEVFPYSLTLERAQRLHALGDSKSTFSTCFCDGGSLAEQTALASAAKESCV